MPRRTPAARSHSRTLAARRISSWAASLLALLALAGVLSTWDAPAQIPPAPSNASAPNPPPSIGQDTVRTVEVETRDGNVYIGTVVSEDSLTIVVKTATLGDVPIRRSDIRRITRIEPSQVRGGEVWHRSAHDTRYFFQSNAYNLRKGEGYYQNAWVFFNQVSYGFTDRFSLGAGFIPTFLFSDAETPVWITPKLSIPLQQDALTLGAGGLVGAVIGEPIGFGILYGNITVGNRDRNLTIAGGYGYADDEDDVDGQLLLGLSASVRIRPKWALMTENYLFADQILSFAGFRHIGRRIAIDGALLIPVGEKMAVPWVSITAPFLTRHADGE